MFFKIGILKNLAIFRGKYLCWSLFLIKLQVCDFLVNIAKSLKVRIHCGIFLSQYFMKHSLMHVSLHIIGFHEIHVKYVKRNPSRTIISKSSICLEYIFSKNTAKQKTKREKERKG